MQAYSGVCAGAGMDADTLTHTDLSLFPWIVRKRSVSRRRPKFMNNS
ncbi:hypothetical protein [Christensenella minuta]|uniref:Uncharacterized protein n=2 Tax=Christensenella minuta TaxID=626937 RepID=A0A136Q4K9_9FIRM|nr:hypothetical protein [Christensenella minuta]KXK65592.1 hypothetical protein HMPREF3293_01516 [Christensenella minuta]